MSHMCFDYCWLQLAVTRHRWHNEEDVLAGCSCFVVQRLQAGDDAHVITGGNVAKRVCTCMAEVVIVKPLLACKDRETIASPKLTKE